MFFSTMGISLLSIFSLFFQPAHATTRLTASDIESHRGQRMILLATIIPSPTDIVQPTVTVTPQPTLVAQDDTQQEFIMNAINIYRKSQGLSPVVTNDLTCNFATIRAQEITTNFSHDGFNQRVQNSTLPYPNYSLITENIAETPNYKDVVNMWIASPGHAKNMREDTPYVCVESNGNYYAYEGWKPQ